MKMLTFVRSMSEIEYNAPKIGSRRQSIFRISFFSLISANASASTPLSLVGAIPSRSFCTVSGLYSPSLLMFVTLTDFVCKWMIYCALAGMMCTKFLGL